MPAVQPAPVVMRAPAAETASPYVIDGATLAVVACNDGTGTAFYVGSGRFVTARHVVVGKGTKCSIGGVEVTVLSMGADEAHGDWAIVVAKAGSAIRMPHVVAYSCSRMRPGGEYLATGYADADPWPVTTRLRATDVVDGDRTREMRGDIVPGMSGGPTADEDGVVYGINDWYITRNGHGVPTSGVVELADTALCGRK